MFKLMASIAVASAIFAGQLAWAQDGGVPEACSTTAEAEVVIGGAGGQAALVTSVARSVPTDPASCVPSYCRASEDEARSVQVAVGAGISDAFSTLIGQGGEEQASRLLDGACRGDCNEIVLTAFAASQGTTVAGLCETSLGGTGGAAPGELVIGVAGGGGGQLPSGN